MVYLKVIILSISLLDQAWPSHTDLLSLLCIHIILMVSFVIPKYTSRGGLGPHYWVSQTQPGYRIISRLHPRVSPDILTFWQHLVGPRERLPANFLSLQTAGQDYWIPSQGMEIMKQSLIFQLNQRNIIDISILFRTWQKRIEFKLPGVKIILLLYSPLTGLLLPCPW